jgi:hypothetical protein
MINQLFRTKFESNLTSFSVFLGLNAVLGLLLLGADREPDSLEAAGFYTNVAVWLVVFCLVAGGLSLLRYNRERSSRLYAQLPVTHRQIRVAYWLHAALHLCISSLVLLLAMFFTGGVPVLEVLLFALLYFFHAGVLLAVLSILASNNWRLIPEEVRRNTVLYFFLATLVIFVLVFGLGFIVAGYGRVQQNGVENWPQLTLLMAVLCAGLVALDIHLFGKKDDYLG